MLSLGEVTAGRARLSGTPEQPPLVLIDLDVDGASGEEVARAARALAERHVVAVGVTHRRVPDAWATLLGALTLTLAPGGPGRSWVATDPDATRRLQQTVAAAPRAALTLANLLPAIARAEVRDGLLLESLAYSTLLAGPEFQLWRVSTPQRPVPAVDDAVIVARHGDDLEITLNRPERHNAFGRAVRDGLIDALEIAALDDSVREVTLVGAGRSFCSGGDLDEFGTATDPASAHLTRLARSAGWRVHQLRDRTRAVLHGACIGAGIEVPAFAGRVEARADAFFQLPEVSMGLIPGAGGTVSLTHRIGTHRTAYLALSGDRIDARTALDWGLVDALV